MENKNLTNPNEEPDWLKDFLESTSDELPFETKKTEPPVEDPEDEIEWIIRQTLSEEFPDPVEEPVKAEPVPTPIKEEPEQEIPEEPVENQAPAQLERKVRPRKKGDYGLFGLPHFISTIIWIVLAVTIGISLGRLLWRCATDVLAFGREDKTIYVTITETDDLESVTQKLYTAGLIEYPSLFRFYAGLSDAMDSISPGTFKLNSLYDYHALVGGMSATSSYRESVEVMIPEGYSCAQIFKLLEEKGVCSAQKLEEYASQSEFADYWFLEGVKRGDKYALEGFLFPDTYEFYTNDTPKRVFIKFLDRFEDQLPDNMEQLLADLNTKLAGMMRKNGYGQSYIDEHKMTLHDVITVASMIEKESAHTGENYNVSSVIYNRLTNEREFRCLQIDATIVYALGGKTPLTPEDLAYDTPYNSYLYGGLPPTPISNPGKSSILAAFSPANTDYYYYALNPETGEHKFSITYQEHVNFLNSLK